MQTVFEKIIEKLEVAGKTELIVNGGRCNGKTLALGYTKGISDAIEIVKQGGVSDDVCECRLLKGYNFLHKTSCGDVFDMENGFKFCPYCGKKIKIVGD